jgi:hypothetical protein
MSMSGACRCIRTVWHGSTLLRHNNKNDRHRLMLRVDDDDDDGVRGAIESLYRHIVRGGCV